MRRVALLAVVVAGLALAGAGAATATPSPVAQADNDTVSAEFEPDTVVAGANTTLLVNTSSDTVTVDSPDLADERLHRVVEGRPSGGEVIANVSDGRVRVRFDECDPTGEYAFVVSDGTMRPNANATVTVVREAEAEPAFRRSVVDVSSGVTARIAIDAGCADRATLHVGSESASFRANTTVALNRSDAVVSLDTDRTDAADALFAAGPNTTLRNTTLAQPSEPPLPPGEYDLTLTVNGTETDVAVLNVSDAPADEGAATPTDGTAVPTVVESPTPTLTPNTPTAGPEPPTASPTPTPVEDGTPTPTDGDDGTPPVTSSDGQPGFGVGTVIISIVLLLFSRRAN